MKMHEVESSAVQFMGYSGRTRELHVAYKTSSTVYVYVDVPFWLVGALFRSKSKGRALHKWVIGKSQFRREAQCDA